MTRNGGERKASRGKGVHAYDSSGEDNESRSNGNERQHEQKNEDVFVQHSIEFRWPKGTSLNQTPPTESHETAGGRQRERLLGGISQQ